MKKYSKYLKIAGVTLVLCAALLAGCSRNNEGLDDMVDITVALDQPNEEQINMQSWIGKELAELSGLFGPQIGVQDWGPHVTYIFARGVSVNVSAYENRIISALVSFARQGMTLEFDYNFNGITRNTVYSDIEELFGSDPSLHRFEGVGPTEWRLEPELSYGYIEAGELFARVFLRPDHSVFAIEFSSEAHLVGLDYEESAVVDIQHLIGTHSEHFMYLSDNNGIQTSYDIDGFITSVFINFLQSDDSGVTFNFNGIGELSTSYDVIGLFGEPHEISFGEDENRVSAESSFYYVLSGTDGMFVRFFFNEDNYVIAINMFTEER